MTKKPGKNPREQLVYHVQELERLTALKQDAADLLKDAFEAAKAYGFDTTTLKVVLKLRQMTPAQRRERRALEVIYLAALGMLDGDALSDEARRRLDGRSADTPSEVPPATPHDATAAAPDSTAPARPESTPHTPIDEAVDVPPPVREAQPTLALKTPEEARAEGADADAAGKRVYDNPYPAGDPCRAAWDEGWCTQQGSHGMETPAAYQRRSAKPPAPPAEPGTTNAPSDATGDASAKGGA